jgi:hypothetical protein
VSPDPDERWQFAQSIARYVESHPQWDVMSPHDAAVHAAHVIATDEGAFNRLCEVAHAPARRLLAAEGDGSRDEPSVGDVVEWTMVGSVAEVSADRLWVVDQHGQEHWLAPDRVHVVVAALGASVGDGDTPRGSGLCPSCGGSIAMHDAAARKRCHDAVSGYQRGGTPPETD